MLKSGRERTLKSLETNWESEVTFKKTRYTANQALEIPALEKKLKLTEMTGERIKWMP